jgi:hypothetical protein
MLEVGRLDQAVASGLADRITQESQARADVRPGQSCSVEIETEDAPLGEVLHMLEEWATLAGLQSLCLRLNGRSYILECPKERDSR